MSITPLMPVYPRCGVRPVRGEGCYLIGERGERYLDFASGGADTQNDVTGSMTAQWTTAPGAFGADRINLYSEIQRSQPGAGIRNETGFRSSL